MTSSLILFSFLASLAQQYHGVVVAAVGARSSSIGSGKNGVAASGRTAVAVRGHDPIQMRRRLAFPSYMPTPQSLTGGENNFGGDDDDHNGNENLASDDDLVPGGDGNTRGPGETSTSTTLSTIAAENVAASPSLSPHNDGGDVANSVTNSTPTAASAAAGSEGDGEGNNSTSASDVGGEGNAKVNTTESSSSTTTTTAASSSAETPPVNASNETSTPSGTTTTNTVPPFDTCIQSAQSDEGNDDILFKCCENHPEEEICKLNSCMDFETEVIVCQCKEVKSLVKNILKSNDPTANFLPDDVDDFLGAFATCCPDSDTSPKDFNDCYYEEYSEDFIDEIIQEYEGQPTYKPTPRPSSEYIPRADDDEDPLSQEAKGGGEEDFSNGQKEDSLGGMINTYLDGVETPGEMESDRNVQVVAISLVVVFLVLMLVTAHLVMEHPDGLCASFCRLILKCFCCVFRVMCLPCRAICCKGSDQTRSRRTHAPMRAPFPSDLELA